MPEILRADFLPEVRVRPFVPGAICARDFNRGDFLNPVAWDHQCPKRTTLPENNFYRGEVILLLFSPVSHLFASVYVYIFIQLVLFVPNHLQPWVSRIQETVLASKAEGTIRNYLADFKRWKLWALSNDFCHMPANTFHVASYLQCLI